MSEITLEELQKYLPIAEQAKQIVVHELVNELRLQPPSRFVLTARNGMVWLIAVMNPRALGSSISRYHNPQVAHQISTAFAGRPVYIANRTGLRYGILLSEKPKLPKKVVFPGFGERDIFRLGVSLRGEVSLRATTLKNVLIGAAQGSGKSNILNLLVHQMRAFGWTLYLADPQEHTFNPDIWNTIAAQPVASTPQDMLSLLERVQAEIEIRKAAFRAIADGGVPPKDLDAYNDVSPDPIARVGVLIDEANTFLGDKAIFNTLADVLRQGRKWGIHIVLAGHEWHKSDVPSRVNDMLQTRLALSTPEEYSGTVVLRSSRWGRWVMDQPPGRGALKFGGKIVPMQFYLVGDQQQLEWFSSLQTVGPLTQEEIAYVKFALEHGGEFNFKKIAAAFDSISEWKARKLAERWERRGWLEPGKNAAAPRTVSQTLVELAGLDGLFGEKLSHAHTHHTASHGSHTLSHGTILLSHGAHTPHT